MEDLVKFSVSIGSFIIIIFTASLISRHRAFSFLLERQGRFKTLDGIRGYLAISVLFHHIFVTWYWKNTGIWTKPPENYYQNYGKVGVAIFFIITGFLFISKILIYRDKLNWFKLFESRVFRIFPLYVFTICIISIFVFYGSGFELNVGFFELILQYIKWGMFHGGDINNYTDTRLVIAYVDWTLKYEWLFYLLLPVIALIINRLKSIGVLMLLGFCLVSLFYPIKIFYISSSYFILFAVGGIAAYACQKIKVPEKLIKSKMTSILAVVIIAITLFYPYTLDPLHILFISALFFLIVFGNDIFGLLTLRSSILLGEISYSIYLLHGVVLYILFTKMEIINLTTYGMFEYLLFMPLITIAVVIVSTITYLIIEKPGIVFGRKYKFTRIFEKLIGTK